MPVMIQIADERGDGALKVDVVFPQGIVGVDQKGLPGRRRDHTLSIIAWGGFDRG
jgi:hypothetical protein